MTEENGGFLAEHRPVFMELRTTEAELDRLDALVTAAKQLRAKLEEQLVKAMDDAMVNRITIDGTTFFRRTDSYPKVKEGEQEALFRWLQEEGRGDMIKPTVNAQSLRSLVIERSKDNLPLPDCLDVHQISRVQTRSK